jgi:nitronate monooxygenase
MPPTESTGVFAADASGSEKCRVSRRDAFGALRARMGLPLVAAPMFLVSGVELVVAACRNGVIGAFPTANCRTVDELDRWLGDIGRRLREHEQAAGSRAAPSCANLIVHRSNARLDADLGILMRHRPEVVITSVGSPAGVVGRLHDAGAIVLADVATIRHAERAIAAGADGLVLLTAGAGGQTGWLNPFAFVRAVRKFFAGPLVLAGGVSDVAYMGTRFIATRESMAPPAYKEMLVNSSADDILLTRAFTGLQTNMLRPSIAAAGLDPDDLPERGPIDIAKDIDVAAREADPKRWRDIWSAGHSVSGVERIASVAELIDETTREYEAIKP